MKIKSLISLFILLQAITNCANLVVAQKGAKPAPAQQVAKCSKEKFTADVKELDSAFSILLRLIGYSPDDGYSSGNADKAHTMSLCPVKTKKEVCLKCVNSTVTYLRKACPKEKEGVAWTASDEADCMVRYGDYIFGPTPATWATHSFASTDAAPAKADELEKGLNSLATKLKSAFAGAANKFASGSVTYGTGKHNLYGSIQCTPATSKENCEKCFTDATSEILNCCGKKGKASGRAMYSNCYFKYSHKSYIPA